jgi:glutamate-1-semialdehyde 2,1-aminomutase
MHGWHDYLYMNIWSPPQYLGRLHPHSAGMLKEAVENTLVVRYNDLDEVEEVLARERGQVAALFVEPVAHNVGCILPKPGFLEGLRDLCTMYDVILIFDEVVTGFRHALGGYQSICGVVPDITVLAKAMSNGYPCAAICGRADLMDNFSSAGGPVTISGTFNANPVGLSAALATIEILEKNEVHHHIFKLGEMMRQGLADITHRLGIPAYVTGVGSTFVSYFLEGPVESFDDVLRHDADLFVAFTLKMIERGFFLLPMSPRRGYISASHTSEDIARTLEAANDSLKEVTGR